MTIEGYEKRRQLPWKCVLTFLAALETQLRFDLQA